MRYACELTLCSTTTQLAAYQLHDKQRSGAREALQADCEVMAAWWPWIRVSLGVFVPVRTFLAARTKSPSSKRGTDTVLSVVQDNGYIASLPHLLNDLILGSHPCKRYHPWLVV